MRYIPFLGVVLLAALSVATIRKDEDPILKTQSEGILFKQKMEEQKDGIKGAPAPSFNFYSKEREKFLIDPPVDNQKEEDLAPRVPENTEVGTDEMVTEGQDDQEDWWDTAEDEDTASDEADVADEQSAGDDGAVNKK